MAISKGTVLTVFLLLLLFSTESDLVKIHRASPRNKSKLPQENNGWLTMCRYIPDFSSLFTKNREAWLYSIPCTFLVGLCGVFPLLVIPVESGHALREGGKLTCSTFTTQSPLLHTVDSFQQSHLFQHIYPSKQSLFYTILLSLQANNFYLTISIYRIFWG